MADYLEQLADELRNQTITAPTVEPLVDTVVEPTTETEIVEPVVENNTTTTQVDDQITDSVTQSKQWWETEEKNQVADQTKKETLPIESKELDLDEDLKLILEYKKNGKSLKDFVNEYKVDDISSWNDEQLVKNGLKEFMELTPEEIEQASYEFDNASFFQKKQWADTFKQRFDQRNQDRLKQLTSSNVDQSEKQKVIANKYNEELNMFSQEIVNKEVYGLKITDEMSKDLKTFIDKEFTLQREDGSFDVEKIYSIGLWLKYGKDMVKANITKAKNEGKEQVIREVSNPSKNMTGGGRTVGSGLEAAQEAFNTLFPG
jgi:hypothetical protein